MFQSILYELSDERKSFPIFFVNCQRKAKLEFSFRQFCSASLLLLRQSVVEEVVTRFNKFTNVD
jgi:hypothetical protein